MARKNKKPHAETLWIVKRFPQKGTDQKKPWFVLTSLRWDRWAASECKQFVNDNPSARVVKVRVTEIPGKKRAKEAPRG